MKLLFIFTGGTIGSTLKGDVISTDQTKSYQLLRAYKEKYGMPFTYDVAEPYTELSENNTGAHIRILGDCIADAVKKPYDGIVVTHGTDTLQYSASAVGYALGLHTVPVCFVAANAPLDDQKSNALDNLRGAVCFIEQKGGGGVFVTYRNSASDTVIVHRATRLLESRAYSDEVISLGDSFYGAIDRDGRFVKNPHFREADDEIEPLPTSRLEKINKRTLVLAVCPGILYPEIPDGVKYVLLNTYHSGTLDTKSKQAKEFFLQAKKKGVTVFATGIYGGPQYASAKLFDELGIHPIMDLSPIAAYVKLWLADSLQKDPAYLLSSSLSGDMFDRLSVF